LNGTRLKGEMAKPFNWIAFPMSRIDKIPRIGSKEIAKSWGAIKFDDIGLDHDIIFNHHY